VAHGKAIREVVDCGSRVGPPSLHLHQQPGLALAGEKKIPLTDDSVEFLDGDLGRADDASKRSAINLVMQRDGDGRTPWADEPYMAAFLTNDGIAELGQDSDAGSSGDDGKRRQGQAATWMSTTS
jgi:hypothetical protein